MDKPIELVYEDTKKELAKVITGCGLPPLVIRPMIQDLLNEVMMLEKSQYNLVKEKYEKSLNNSDTTAEVEP